MHPRILAATCTLLALVLAGPGRAEEEPIGGHARHPQKVIVLDSDRIVPSELDMSEGDVLVFENQSIEPIVVTFVDPKNVGDRIRCGLIRKTEHDEARAPWLLFQKTGDQLSATIPPGRFASVCSLSPGKYAFTATHLSLRTTTAGGVLPNKGQITVK
jgi:hypothetical protein